MHEYKVRPAGDTALVVEFGVNLALSPRVLGLAE
jgi:hypothetical protein